jgi:hypothetical protein
MTLCWDEPARTFSNFLNMVSRALVRVTSGGGGGGGGGDDASW